MEFCAWRPWKLLLTVGRKPSDLPLVSGVSVHAPGLREGCKTEEMQISWSGRGRCYETILVERLMEDESNMRSVPARANAMAWKAE